VYPKPIPPGEQWYYQLDGRAHGPLSRSDLEDLLNRSGETASEVCVRQGTDGPWHPYRMPTAAAARDPALTSRQRPHSAQSADEHSEHPPSLPTHGSVPALVADHWQIGAAAVAWILLNVLFLTFWPQSYARERRYTEALRAIEAEVQELRAKPATDEEWKQLIEQTRTTLAPIVSDLKKSASASEPIKQQLFWAASDLIPRTLGPRTKERDEYDRRLNLYLDTAEREMNGT
jgi:hypothetical protein